MIEFLSSWAEQIIVAVIAASIIEMILPEGKNKKYVKMVIGIYILFNIISPIINEKDLISFDNFNLESYAADIPDTSIQEEKVNQESMDERLQQLYVQELENNIKTKVQKEGYKVNYCKVDAVLYGDEKKQGINSVVLEVSKSDVSIETKGEMEQQEEVKSVDKVDIQVGLNKYLDTNNVQESNKTNNDSAGIKNLKQILSDYYEIESNKIHISAK